MFISQNVSKEFYANRNILRMVTFPHCNPNCFKSLSYFIKRYKAFVEHQTQCR